MNYQAITKNTHSKEPRRAVCYVRVASAADSDSAAAIRAQREACERKARELGATIVDVYTDVDSGSAFGHRPALQAMLARTKSEPHVSSVITYDHARLARNIEAYRKIAQALKTAGVELVIAQEPGPHFHKFMQTLISAMAELTARDRRYTRRPKKVSS